MTQISAEEEIRQLEAQKAMLKEALDGLIDLLKQKNAEGKPNPAVQELVEKALTALMFGDVTVAEKWLNEAAGQLGIDEEAAEKAAGPEGSTASPGGPAPADAGCGPPSQGQSADASAGQSSEEEAASDESQEEIPPAEEIEDLIGYFAERIEEYAFKGIAAEKTMDILVKAQEAFERGDLDTAWRAARTGIKAFDLEVECLEAEKKG